MIKFLNHLLFKVLYNFYYQKNILINCNFCVNMFFSLEGWHLVAFGIWSDYLFSNLYKPSVNGYALSQYVPGIGNYVAPNSLYIGWMTWTDVNTNYIIHSIRILTTNSSTVFNPFSNAVYNRKFHLVC